MLHEIVGLADEPPAKRRWFHDEYFDLFVWQAFNGDVLHFELCYGIHASEQAVIWHRQTGFFHDGDWGKEPVEALLERFAETAPTLPKPIRQVVEVRLREFVRHVEEVPSRRQSFRRAPWQKKLKPAARAEPAQSGKNSKM